MRQCKAGPIPVAEAVGPCMGDHGPCIESEVRRQVMLLRQRQILDRRRGASGPCRRRARSSRRVPAGSAWRPPRPGRSSPRPDRHPARRAGKPGERTCPPRMVLQARRWLPDRDLVLHRSTAASRLLFGDAMRSRRRHRHHPPASVDVGALRARAAPPAGHDRPPAQEGRALAHPARCPRRREHRLAERTGGGLVRRGRAPHRDRLGHRRVAARRACPSYRSRWVLVRDPERRFAPQALLCTDPARDPAQIIAWFVRRWQVEVTFQEARAHLGVETQRQWSDRASRAHDAMPDSPCSRSWSCLADRLPALRAATGCDHGRGTPSPVPPSATPWPPCAREIWREQRLVTSAAQGASDETPPQPAGALGLRSLPRLA